MPLEWCVSETLTSVRVQIERFPLKMSKHYLLIGRGGEVVKTIEGGSQTAICFATEPAMKKKVAPTFHVRPG